MFFRSTTTQNLFFDLANGTIFGKKWPIKPHIIYNMTNKTIVQRVNWTVYKSYVTIVENECVS